MVAPSTGRVLAVAALAAAALGGGAAAEAGSAHLGRTDAASADPASRTGPARVARTTAMGIGAREYRFAVYRARVRRGVVLFELTNYGQDAHDLVVETGSGRRLGRTGRVRSGGRAALTLHLAPGAYRLVCDLANHAALGMRTTIRVTR